MESLEPRASDGTQSDTLSSTATVSKSSRKGSKTDASMKPQSLETLTTSSSPVPLKNTRALSTWLQRAFPASHSALLESKKEKKTAATCGRQRSNVFATFDPDTHSWRTSQVCLVLATSAKSSLRWPKQGSMQDGLCSELTMWVPRTDVRGSGSKRLAKTPSAADAFTGNLKKEEFRFGNSGSLAQEVESGFMETHRMWPTPIAMDGKNTIASREAAEKENARTGGGVRLSGAVQIWPTPRVSDTEGGIVKNVEMKDGSFSRVNKQGVRWGVKLKDAVAHTEKIYPTPTARDWKDNGKSPAELVRNSETLATKAGGSLNPTWVEWLMGWPLGWTDLKPLEMDKFRQWQQQHGGY